MSFCGSRRVTFNPHTPWHVLVNSSSNVTFSMFRWVKIIDPVDLFSKKSRTKGGKHFLSWEKFWFSFIFRYHSKNDLAQQLQVNCLCRRAGGRAVSHQTWMSGDPLAVNSLTLNFHQGKIEKRIMYVLENCVSINVKTVQWARNDTNGFDPQLSSNIGFGHQFSPLLLLMCS